ncbi:MAG TPA: cysteine desulfurase [Candidatus Kapabacteria bacterium]|nr:cysteine desulfurase [Candidatus Kapabacteria bacterium]
MIDVREIKTTKGKKTANGTFDVNSIRKDFPILSQYVHGKPLVYLDNAATTQKPNIVIETLEKYYREQNANIHRGVHYLSDKATDAYEQARGKVKTWINAAEAREIIFVRGTTEAINLVASSFGKKFISDGDEVIISAMEHHSNIVPWQIACEERDAMLRVIPVNDAGELLLEEYEKLLTERTKLVAITHISNVLGTVNPVKQIVAMAHAHGIPVLVDGAQAVQHTSVDVRDLDCDFYAFSSHKIYGPTGVGVLYGKAKWLEQMPPYQGGGDMIRSVTFEKTTYNTLPYKFEAGTPNIAGGIGLGAALDYLGGIGMDAVAKYEQSMLAHATTALSAVQGLRIIGTAKEKASVISFELENVHPHDIGTILDTEGIAIRTGHHCAQPLMQRFGVPATARASFAFYNTWEEVGALVEALARVKEIFG